MEAVTQDFYLTAYLHQCGLKLRSLRENGGRKLFIFDDSEEFQRLKRDYYFNKASVDPLLFKATIRELKALIMNN